MPRKHQNNSVLKIILAAILVANLAVALICLFGAISLGVFSPATTSLTAPTAGNFSAIQPQVQQPVVAGDTTSTSVPSPQLIKSSTSTETSFLTATPAVTTLAPTGIIQASVPPAAPSVGTLRYHVIKVGQGDSALIQSPDGWNILIDGGEANSGALQYIQSLGITHLNLVIATHPHSDHIGGLTQVLKTFQVDKVITNGENYTTATYSNFLDAILSGKIPYAEAKAGDTISAGILSFHVLDPPGGSFNANPNENSVVLKFTYGQTTFLLMGDAGKVREPGLLSSGISLKADILKVGHHASSYGSSPAFLQAVHPAIAIYSAGLGNSYGHPSPITVAALTAVGAQIYGTDKDGTIIVTVTSDGYKINGTSVTAILPTAPPSRSVGGISVTKIVSSPGIVRRGGNASVSIKTTVGASCSITVTFKSGPSSAAGLGSQIAGSNGSVVWTWKVGSKTTPGTWPISITCGGQTQSANITVQ